MKSTKFTLSLLLIAVLLSSAIKAQNYNTQFVTKMNKLFQQIDKSKITSGLLSDYALELVDISAFNGIPADSNYVSPDTWLNLYSTVYNAKINNLITLQTPETVKNFILNRETGSSVELLMMHYEYDKLDDDALTKGWLSYDGTYLYDVANKPSPYLKKQLFAVAPVKIIFNNLQVSFVFRNDLFYKNVNKPISKLEVNFNGEGGFKTVQFNTPISHTFTSEGIKTIQYRLTYTDGAFYTSRTNIVVNAQPPSYSPDIDHVDQRITIPSNYKHSGGVLEICFSPQSVHDKKIRKPLIMAAPFDPYDCLKDIVDNAKEIDLNNILNTRSDRLKEVLSDYLEYDIIFVRYSVKLDDLFRNAELFKDVIRYVNENKITETPNVVIGFSMGGLIARYALRTMELYGEDHKTWKYISYDSPHKGANIPLGFQAMVRHIENYQLKYFFWTIKTVGEMDKVKGVCNILNSKATKQLLIYYCNQNMNINNTEHENFQRIYDNAGFPLKCQNIIISNGSANGTGYLNPGASIFKLDFSFNLGVWIQMLHMTYLGHIILYDIIYPLFPELYINVIPGKSSIYADFKVNALPDRSVAKIYEGYIGVKKLILNLIPVSIAITNKTLYSQNYMLPIDGAPGSRLEIGNFTPGGSSGILNIKDFCFAPTVSTLAMSNWENNLTATNLISRDIFQEGVTGFEDFYKGPNKMVHVSFDDETLKFLTKHLATPPISFDLKSPMICGKTQINLKNPNNTPITWSSSTGFALSEQNNFSVKVLADEGKIGIISAKSNVNVTKPGLISLIGSSYQMTQRKRLESSCNLYIFGLFNESSMKAVYKVKNLPLGTPITWSINNNSNFRIVSFAADSVVIEALSYSKQAVLKATVDLGNIKIVEHNITSPNLNFYKPFINCLERDINITRLVPEYNSITWSTTSTYNLQIISGANSPTVRVKGLNNSNSAKLKVQVNVKGETFTAEQTCTVSIPNSLTLTVASKWREGNTEHALIKANVLPYYDIGAYWWTANCKIKPCVTLNKEVIIDEIAMMELKDLENNFVIVGPGEISEELYESLTTGMNKENTVIKRYVAVTDDSGNNYMVLEILEKSELSEHDDTEELIINTKYFTISDTNMNFPNNTPPLNEPQLTPLIPEIPENDPSYAVATYQVGKTAIISCHFFSQCSSLTASTSIVNSSLKCIYSTQPETIYITNENEVPEIGNYTIYIFNDFGIILQTQISKNFEMHSIPMHSYPKGFYYINIVDDNGNVVVQEKISTL